MTRRWLDPNFFTDEKVGRLSMPERQLFAAMIANQDDDGRLKGHPAYLRSITFPYDELTTDEVRRMRDHIAEVNPNVMVYQNTSEDYIQLKRHRRYQRPRYYNPSKLPAPPGWPFEDEPLKNEYKGDVEKTIQYAIANKLRSGQWQPTGEKITDVELNKRLGNLYADIVAKTPSRYILIEVKQYALQFRDLGQIIGYRKEMETRGSTPVIAFLIGNGLGNLSPEEARANLVTLLNLDLTPLVDLTHGDVEPTTQSVKPPTDTEDRVGLGKGLDLDLDKGRVGRGGKRLPSPSPTDFSTDIHKILDKCLESFRIEFGKVPAESPDTIIPREPSARERAQIRDLALELVRVGGCPLSYIREVFREAAGQEEKSKKSVSYVRAIILDWLGVERNRSP